MGAPAVFTGLGQTFDSLLHQLPSPPSLACHTTSSETVGLCAGDMGLSRQALSGSKA